MSVTEMRSDMPMRLIVRTAALVVTSGIAVTALLAGPHGGIPAWGTGLVLSIVLLAVTAGAALDVAEWKEAQRGHLPGGDARHARVAVASSGHAPAAPAAVPDSAGRVGGGDAAVAAAGLLHAAIHDVAPPPHPGLLARRRRAARGDEPHGARRMAGALFGLRRVADQAAGRDDHRNRHPRTGGSGDRAGASRAAWCGSSGCSRILRSK